MSNGTDNGALLIRVAAYVDGYNLYHAVKRAGADRHKWLDLWSLCGRFIPSRTAKLVAVHYFSAYAQWKPEQMTRHRAYVAALEVVGVTPHMSRFATKDRSCPHCGHAWKGHEEKETDVKLAVSLLQHAVEDRFDRALIVSRDSDLVPAAKALKTILPKKQVIAVAPPHAGHSTEMLKFCDGKAKIKRHHLDACLLPRVLRHPERGEIVRPAEYDSRAT